MADPATIGLAVKAAAAALSDERLRKTIGWIVAAVLSPLILIIVLICGLVSGSADHNNAAVDLTFNGGSFSASVPAEYTAHIREMKACFAVLDQALSDAQAGLDDGSLDSVRIKSVYYSLYFGADHLILSADEARAFVGCFIAYTENGAGETVAVPASLETAYQNLSAAGIPVSAESRNNVSKIYERIVYGGAGSYTGEIVRGGGSGVPLEGLVLLNPDIKNNRDLVTYAENAFASGWGYVWGTFGDVLTDSLFAYKLEQYPDGVGNYEDFIRGNWLGGRTTDCVGLIKGYGWFNPTTKAIEYGTNGMPDVGADGMYNAATVKGSMDTMPDTPGLAVWKSGHIGVYVGNGEVVEAMGTKYGVVRTKLEGRNWTAWLEVPYISYLTD